MLMVPEASEPAEVGRRGMERMSFTASVVMAMVAGMFTFTAVFVLSALVSEGARTMLPEMKEIRKVAEKRVTPTKTPRHIFFLILTPDSLFISITLLYLSYRKITITF